MIREVVTGFLDGLDGRDTFDVVADFSALFPVEIISRMLGVPEGRRQQIREASTSACTEPGEVGPPEGAAAAMELVGYFHELIGEKGRTRPTTC